MRAAGGAGLTPVTATHARRLTAQLLAGRPARDPLAVAERLLAIQAQDPRAARLAVRARTAGVTVADVDRELTEARSLVITTLNRGTLHLVRSEDYALLQSLTTPPLLAGSHRRLAQEGLDPDTAARGMNLIESWIERDGPRTRADLAERLRRAGIPLAGQALVHLIYRASIEGRIVRGPMIGAQHAFALVRHWLADVAPGSPPPRDAALAELARRYLAGHGPASERDLARWAGLPLRDARAGLEAIATELVPSDGGLVDLRKRGRRARLPAPRLLGAFEPVLLGWSSRAEVTGGHEARIISGGVFRGFALADGRAVAVWRFAGQGVAIQPFGRLPGAVADALEADAAAVTRFLAT